MGDGGCDSAGGESGGVDDRHDGPLIIEVHAWFVPLS